MKFGVIAVKNTILKAPRFSATRECGSAITHLNFGHPQVPCGVGQCPVVLGNALWCWAYNMPCGVGHITKNSTNVFSACRKRRLKETGREDWESPPL